MSCWQKPQVGMVLLMVAGFVASLCLVWGGLMLFLITFGAFKVRYIEKILDPMWDWIENITGWNIL